MNDDGAPSGALTWEWTADWFSAGHEVKTSRCCPAENPLGAPEEGTPCYCRRYRPAARHARSVDTSASHVGFRCIVRGPHG
jgi:formylglycine-generating enzyme